MLFTDRFDAALRLIPVMKNYRGKDAIIYSIPGGGVPLGYYLAKDLNLPMELLFSKKIMYPQNGKSAIGAVTLTDHFIDERLNIPDAYSKNEVNRIRKVLNEQEKLFADGREKAALKGKHAILVDDGIATGNTMLSAIRLIRKYNPAKITVVVPVSSSDAAARIRSEADEFVCLHTVSSSDISSHYLHYPKVSDKEIVQLHKAANRLENAA